MAEQARRDAYNAYQREWSRKHPESKQRIRARHHARLAEAKTGLGGCCERCGITDYRLLQFDHLIPDEKLHNVAHMCGISDQRFFEEVAKCRLLCANCHHLHTHYPDESTIPE
jgi:hypothetical protein